jgi:hypothetical protein
LRIQRQRSARLRSIARTLKSTADQVTRRVFKTTTVLRQRNGTDDTRSDEGALKTGRAAAGAGAEAVERGGTIAGVKDGAHVQQWDDGSQYLHVYKQGALFENGPAAPRLLGTWECLPSSFFE